MLHRVTPACLLLLACACAAEPAPQREWTPDDHGHPKQADPARTPQAPTQREAVSPEEAEARAARALFNVSCAGCHGRDGRGDGPSKPPGAQMPDMTAPEWQEARSDEQLTQGIAQGKGLMPGFDKQINADGIAALVRLVRSMAAAAPAEQPSGAAPAAAAQPAAAQPAAEEQPAAAPAPAAQ